jgi:hypothetical protein
MRWPRWPKKSEDKRKAARAAVDGLDAIYWDGSASSCHPVRDVSLAGAQIATDVVWAEGTLIRIGFRPVAESGSTNGHHVYSGLWCRVVRTTTTGFGIEFLFFDRAERKTFQEFLLTNVRSYGEALDDKKSRGASSD